MNREIKFRAWDKYLNKMIQPNGGDSIGWHAMSNWKDCLEVMQFTGLKDKNGKEIYEGDIVKVKGIRRIGEYLTLIVWNNQGFYLKENKTYLNDNMCFISIKEVIGNIYESPELINKEVIQ